MQIRTTRTGYGAIARALHWWMAALVIGLIGLGLYMTDQPDGDPKWALYDLHKSLGTLLFMFLVLRIVWRKMSPPPPLPAGMVGFEAFAAHAGHLLLYAAMIALPLTGYLDSAFGGYHISFFGWFDVPMLFEKDKPLFELAELAHHWIGYALALLVLAHAGAALKHHFVQKDDVLLRMLKDRPD